MFNKTGCFLHKGLKAITSSNESLDITLLLSGSFMGITTGSVDRVLYTSFLVLSFALYTFNSMFKSDSRYDHSAKDARDILIILYPFGFSSMYWSLISWGCLSGSLFTLIANVVPIVFYYFVKEYAYFHQVFGYVFNAALSASGGRFNYDKLNNEAINYYLSYIPCDWGNVKWAEKACYLMMLFTILAAIFFKLALFFFGPY